LQIQTDNEQNESKASIELEQVSRFADNDHHEHYPAPSTPQLKQVGRLLDDGDCQEQTNCSTENCQEQTNCSTEKESGEHDGESKSVEITCENLNAESITQQTKSEATLVQKEEEEFADASKCESVVSPQLLNVKVLNNSKSNTTSANKVGVRSHKCEIKANRKKMKVSCFTIHSSHNVFVPLFHAVHCLSILYKVIFILCMSDLLNLIFLIQFWYFGLR